MEACLTTVSVAAPSRFHLLVILFQPTVRNSFSAGRKTLRELPKAPQDAWQGFGNARFHRNGILFQADVPASPARCLASFRMFPKAPQDAGEAFGKPIIPSLCKFIPIGCTRKVAVTASQTPQLFGFVGIVSASIPALQKSQTGAPFLRHLPKNFVLSPKPFKQGPKANKRFFVFITITINFEYQLCTHICRVGLLTKAQHRFM